MEHSVLLRQTTVYETCYVACSRHYGRTTTMKTMTLKIILWRLNGLFVQLHTAQLQISVWSSGLSVVGGTDRDTVEKLKEGDMKTCLCMKAELSSKIFMEHAKVACVLLTEADAGQVQESGLEVDVGVSECVLWKKKTGPEARGHCGCNKPQLQRDEVIGLWRRWGVGVGERFM